MLSGVQYYTGQKFEMAEITAAGRAVGAKVLPATHCTLHIEYCTLHTAQCTLHTVHCTLHTTQ